MKNNSKQKAGNNSSQYQIETVNIQNGISIEEWKNLLNEENKLTIANSQLVAETTANERLKEYGNVLLPKLVKAEMLSCFSDPNVQFLFRQTQKTAICTDRECDYEILSEMLIHKVENKTNYTISAAIEKAINEVNNISEESLMMLTIIYSVTTYYPVSYEIKKGLKALDDLYGRLLTNFELPKNFDWLENLDVTNAIRIGTFGGTKKLDDFFCERLKFYTSKGIKKSSDNYNKTLELLKDNNLPISNLIDNDLDNNYVKIPVLDNEEFDNLYVTLNVDGTEKRIDLSDNQKKALKNVYDLYEHGNLNGKFKEELNKYQNIKKIIEWWNANMLDHTFKITAVGRVLACTNARRIDSSLPKFQ